jgi:glycosyltransferase involved in cell wall biosynthesis
VSNAARPFITLPIPSAIPRCDRIEDAAGRRRTLATSGQLVGHFGTYGTHVAPMLRSALTTLFAEERNVSALCVGAGSDDFVRSMIAASPDLAGRLQATGRTTAPETAIALSACDLLLQPYLDGVTTRRTSVMAGLINARPIVTTTGHLTEPIWAETQSVVLTASGDTKAFVQSARALLDDEPARAALASRAEKTYSDRFALSHTIARLRETSEGAAA